MSEKAEKKEAPAPAAPPKASKGFRVLGVILPALFAGGAAFGGARAAGGHTAKASIETPGAPQPPGPTLPLEPFLVTLAEANGKAHAMKVVLAIEFSSVTKEDVIKPLTPRVRDGALTYLRSLSWDTTSDRSKLDTIRNELLEAVKKAGATTAERVLITDLVIQ